MGSAQDSLTVDDQPGQGVDGVRIEIVDPEAESSSSSIEAAAGGRAVAGSAEVDVEVEGSRSGADDGPPRYTVVAQAVVPALTARTAPDDEAPAVAEFTHPTASGSPLVFRSIDSANGASPEWIEVQLPIEPNGTTGWIRRSEVELFDNPYRIEIDRASYSLKVFDRNQLWLETVIAVGNGATPTPVGEFYLLELLAPPEPNGPYGPYAFGLSGFSEVLTDFGGSDVAIIGLHGTNDPSSLGTEVSHGCVRLENAVIEELATVLPLGTPVRIT